MKKDDEKILKLIRDRFEEAQSAEAEQREMMLDDMEFENGDQWDEMAKKERDEDGRPSLVINKVAGLVKTIIGDMRQNRPGIKARPVDSGSDPKVAEILTGLVRNIENVSSGDDAYDMAGEHAVRCGLGYFRITTDYTTDSAFEQDICIDRIENPFTVYRDPFSRKITGEDSRYYFVSERISREEYKERYPESEEVSFDEMSDKDVSWIEEDELRIAEYWWVKEVDAEIAMLQNGMTVDLAEVDVPPEMILKQRKAKRKKVQWVVTNGYEILEGPTDWSGKFIPIIPVCGEEVWIEGRRYYRSAIYHAKDPQRLYNWARSTACETLAMAPRQPWVTTPGAIAGFENDWAEANKRPLAYLLHNDGFAPPTRQGPTFPDNGSMSEAMASADDIKATTGIYDASLGARGNETSGRAIIARQQEGDTATFVFHDNLNKALKYAGKILVDLIPKVYDTQRVVRLLNPDGTEGWQTVNAQMPDGSTMHDLSAGSYDVVVDTSANYQTKRLEAADSMAQFIQAFPPAAQVVGPRLAKNLDWPEADAIAQELAALSQGGQQNPQQQQAAMQQQQMAMQAQQAEMQAKVQQQQAKAQAEAQSAQLDAQKGQADIAKAQQELQLGQLEIEKKQLENEKIKRELMTPAIGV